jgi:hypothetical protein
MKVKIEIKGEDKLTSYTADFEQAEEAIKTAVDKMGEFLKATFKKEVFTKEEEK